MVEPHMPCIATLATRHAWDDLCIFVRTLALWNQQAPPTIYLSCDTEVASKLHILSYPGRIVHRIALDPYANLVRGEMEGLPSKQGRSNLFFDFVMEKLDLLEWTLSEEPSTATAGLFFFDADICFLGPLPTVPPGYEVALSPHAIREQDERRYGIYNAGFLWVRGRSALDLWRTACESSTFYEQIALNCFDTEPGWSERTYRFPIQHNYGWWRLWQGRRPVAELMAEWSLFRDPSGRSAGIRVDGKALQSIHTHWHERKDMATAQFNRYVASWLKKLAGTYAPAAALLKVLPAV